MQQGMHGGMQGQPGMQGGMQQPGMMQGGGQQQYGQQQYGQQQGMGQMGQMGQMGPGGVPPPIDINNPMFQMAASSGAQFFDNGHKMLQNNVQQYVSMGLLRYYFSVDTAYVLAKLRILLWPFTHKDWKRAKDEGSLSGYLAPRHDVNAPDLYIPVMAFVTYIVGFGLHQGWLHSFTPEVLGKTASSGILIMVLEVAALKLGFYILDGPPNRFIDFFCYCGYKYVGIVASTVAYIFVGVHWPVILYVGLAMSWFMFKTLATVLILRGGDHQMDHRELSTPHYFVFAMAMLQLPVTWLMGI